MDLQEMLKQLKEIYENMISFHRVLGISISKRMARVDTIDTRVDYLRVGEGAFFTASGSVLRTGNKVAVIRTESCNGKNLLIAACTGTYLVG